LGLLFSFIQALGREGEGGLQVSAARAVAVLPVFVLVILTFLPHDPDCWAEFTATIQSESDDQF
jgi:hypothetical protein